MTSIPISMVSQSYLEVFFGSTYAIAVVTVTTFVLVMSRQARRNRDACCKAVEIAVARGLLRDNDYDDLLALHKIPEQQSLQILRELLERFLTTENVEAADRIRALLGSYKEKKPFAELPDDIRIQLDQITEQCPAQRSSIGQLAHSLTDIYRKRQVESQKEKRKSTYSLAFGVLGVLLSIVSIVPSCSHTSAGSAVPASAQQSSPNHP